MLSGENFTSIKEKYWNEEKECFTSGPIGSEAYEKGWWETTGAEMVLWPRFGIATERQRNLFLKTIESNPEAFSEFGINWYPFRKEKNHFWRAFVLKAFCLNTYLEFNVFLYGCYS